MPENKMRAKRRPGKKILPIVQRATWPEGYTFNRKKEGVNGKLKSQMYGRWELIERIAVQTNNKRRRSLRMNQSVMCGNYLMVETFNWKIEGNKSGKKETTNRGGCTTLKNLYLIARKNAAGVKLRSYKRWARSDGMMWEIQLGKRMSLLFKKRKHIKWKVGIRQEW